MADLEPFCLRPKKDENPANTGLSSYSGGRIRTCDLRVMSPTSYLAAPPRVAPTRVPVDPGASTAQHDDWQQPIRERLLLIDRRV